MQRRAARCRCSWSVIIRSRDETTLHKNADRVAAIFNALSIFVLVVGALGAIAVLIAGFAGAGIVNGQFVVPAGGQEKVPVPVRRFSRFWSWFLLGVGLVACGRTRRR